jgi:CRP-like cAMP-binding protein
MADTTVLETLQGMKFLEGVPDEDVRRLAGVARFEDHEAGAMLFREWEKLDRIFLLISGNVGLEVCVPGGKAQRVNTVGPGNLLGWSPVLNQQPMTASARALTPVRLIALDAAQVYALCQQDPRFGFTFMRRTAEALAARLHATRLQLLNIHHHEHAPMASVTEGAD